MLALVESTGKRLRGSCASDGLEQASHLGLNQSKPRRAAFEDQVVDTTSALGAEYRDSDTEDRRDQCRRRARRDAEIATEEAEAGCCDEQRTRRDHVADRDRERPLGSHELMVGSEGADEVRVRIG